MEKAERAKLHIKIFIRIAGQLFVPPDDPTILPLGDEYANSMSGLLKKRTELFQQIVGDLSHLSVEQLKVWFDVDGKPLTADAIDLIKRHKSTIKDIFGRLKVWYLAPLFRTDELADFDYWGRAEFLSIDEVVWLSLGLEPSDNLRDAIKPFNKHGMPQKHGAIETYVSRHKEVIRRKFDPHNYGVTPELTELRSWIEEVRLAVHPEFLRIIDQKSKTESRASESLTRAPETSELDGREKVSMSKLIAAMAIDAYGFDPKAKRSEIPIEIQGIADRLGLDLSVNTIRKYLKKGAEMIPEDWKPE